MPNSVADSLEEFLPTSLVPVPIRSKGRKGEERESKSELCRKVTRRRNTREKPECNPQITTPSRRAMQQQKNSPIITGPHCRGGGIREKAAKRTQWARGKRTRKTYFKKKREKFLQKRRFPNQKRGTKKIFTLQNKPTSFSGILRREKKAKKKGDGVLKKKKKVIYRWSGRRFRPHLRPDLTGKSSKIQTNTSNAE